MKITILPAAELKQHHIEAWSQIQRANSELASPYFRPEFTQVVASVRDDVEVAVLEEHGEMIGFFPFQRLRRGIAQPVGGRMSNFQAIIIRQGIAWDPVELLKKCRLKAWHFDHLLGSQEELRPFCQVVEDSPYIDLSGGYEAYLTRLGQNIENPFPRLTYYARKMSRDIGPLRFEFGTSDQHVFDTLLEWKSQQYQRTGATDRFAFAWSRAVLERIWRLRGEAFAGALCALYAGDRLVAAHFGMRSYGVMHYWYPTYDTDFGKLSPGVIRDLELIKAAASQGIWRIDLGKGINLHKERFMSAAIQVAVGSVDLRPVMRMVQRQWHRAYQWARGTPLRRPARVPARILYRVHEWYASR